MADSENWERIAVQLGSDYSGWVPYSFNGRQVGVVHKKPFPFDSRTHKYTVYRCPDEVGPGYRFLEEGRDVIQGLFKRLHPKNDDGRYYVMREGDAATGWFSDIMSMITRD